MRFTKRRPINFQKRRQRQDLFQDENLREQLNSFIVTILVVFLNSLWPWIQRLIDFISTSALLFVSNE